VLLAYLRGIVGAQEGVAALALKCTGLPVHVLHKENLVGFLELLVQVFWPNLAPQIGLLALRV